MILCLSILPTNTFLYCLLFSRNTTELYIINIPAALGVRPVTINLIAPAHIHRGLTVRCVTDVIGQDLPLTVIEVLTFLGLPDRLPGLAVRGDLHRIANVRIEITIEPPGKL